MPTYKINSILKGLSSFFEEEPKTEQKLAEFLDRVDVTYGNADSSLSEDEWQTGLASDEAYNLINYGSGSEEYWQNVFGHISRRFASSSDTVSNVPPGASKTPAEKEIKASSSDLFIPTNIEEDENEKNLTTTDSLIDEIENNTQGIDRHYLVYLCEEESRLLVMQGRVEEAAEVLEHLSILYQEHGDVSNFHFALARASLFYGDFDRSLTSLNSISSSSPLGPMVAELRSHLLEMKKQQEKLNKVMSAGAALEQMRMRALEQLAFDESQIHDTWLEPDAWTDSKREVTSRLISKVNRGINEMVQALLDGKVSTAEEAFAHFHEYTTLHTALDGNPPFNGEGFKQILSGSGNVDVEGLIGFSKIRGQEAREQWLLRYTEGLRKNYASTDGFPANTIERNLTVLKESKDPAIKARAKELYANVTGESAVTGLSDAAFAGLLREGGKETVSMVLAMMIAGPAGAYAEGATAVRLATGGISLGRAGWAGRAIGFGVEATLFWGANDALHATLIGEGDYFTGHGLASSFLMLGGLRVLGGAWNVTGGAYLAKAAQSSKALAPILGGVNQSGQLATEFGGFWGLGQFEEIIGLVPPQETTLRQELAQTAMTLMQLKMAVAAGQMVTGHLAEIKTLEIKLESTTTLLRTAAKRGSFTPAELTRALRHIEGLKAGLDTLKSTEPFGPSKKTPDGWPDSPDDGSGKGGGPIDPLSAISRNPVTQQFKEVSWDRVGIPQADIDALYRTHESLLPERRTEHGLFRFEDGTGVVLAGEKRRTESLVLEAGDEYSKGTVKELSPIAHVHHDEPLPSINDLLVFTARGRLNPNIPQTHTVFGYVDGERAFVQMTIRIQGNTTQIDFRTSDNFPEALRELFQKRGKGIAQTVRLANSKQLADWAIGSLAQNDAELCYEFADPGARRELEARDMPDAERATLQKMIGRTRLDVIENATDLEPILSAFEVYVIRDLPQQPVTSKSVLETQLDHFEHFVQDCLFLMNDRGLDAGRIKDIMGGAYGPPRDFVESLKTDPKKFPLLVYQASSVNMNNQALKRRQGAITRSIQRPHQVKRSIQISVDSKGFADGVYQSLGIDTRIITRKPDDPALSRDDKAHIRSKTALFADLEKRTVDLSHYKAIVDSLSPVELDILMELKRFFGEKLFWQVMSNPSLYPVEDARYTLLKTVLNTLDFYRGSDGKIEEKYRLALEEHFISGKQIVFGQPDTRPDKKTGILTIKDLWGQAAEFKLMTTLKFSSSHPDSFVLGEKLPYSETDKDECDAYDRRGRVIHETKNAYLGITPETIINNQFKKHVYSLKNNGVKSLEYDLITYIPREFYIDRSVIERVRDSVRREGLKSDQTVVINLYNKEGELGRKIVIGPDGAILLDTARP